MNTLLEPHFVTASEQLATTATGAVPPSTCQGTSDQNYATYMGRHKMGMINRCRVPDTGSSRNKAQEGRKEAEIE